MILTLKYDDLRTVVDEGPVVTVTGTATTGKRVRFAGEHRQMGYLPAEIASGQPPVQVIVKKWQVLDNSTLV